MGTITICTFITASINLLLFTRLAFYSPYSQMPVIKSEGVNSLILNSVWIVYSISAYMMHRVGFQKCNWIYGCIHYIILIVQYSTYKFDYVKFIREYLREGTFKINEYNISSEEMDYAIKAYLPQEIQIINVQLFIYISMTLISSWGISSMGFVLSAMVYFATQVVDKGACKFLFK